MVKEVKYTIEYFRAPKNYFWQWTENGEVIEWKNGATICYREDLLFVLNNLQIPEAPSLSAILLVLACCNDNFQEGAGKGILSGIVQTAKSFNQHTSFKEDKQVLEYHLHQALRFMDMVSRLPAELRKGTQRIHLLYEIFSPSTFSIAPSPLKNLVEELKTGKIDELVFKGMYEIDSITVQKDLAYLSTALQKFLTVESLALRLRTGLDKMPPVIEITAPEETPLDLWQQLAADNKTAGIARLARHLIAALNIPMHSQGKSDLSFGGISDITNRGNYDRLLLSELAHDDELLMARLVNNEALYFRREEPPDNPKLQRTILLDTTIKMWGLPRVFAVSAALACAHHTKHGEAVEAYALGGKDYASVDLGNKEGILTTLGMLDASLHCGNALRHTITNIPAAAQNEYLFITDAQSMQSPEFHAALDEVKESLSFMISVSRNGELLFYEYIKGRAKLLSKAKFDLEELLFAKDDTGKPVQQHKGLPIFMETMPVPLYYPKARVKIAEKNMYHVEDVSAIAVTETQRVLYIWNKLKGAIELLDYIEKGTYTFGGDGQLFFYIVVHNTNKNLLKFYQLNLRMLDAQEINLSDEIQFAKEIIFEGNTCYIRTIDDVFTVSGISCTVQKEHEKSAYESVFNKFKKDTPLSYSPPNGFINNYYSILFNVKDIHVSDVEELAFGNHHLRAQSSQHISFVDQPKGSPGTKYAKSQGETYYPLRNKNIKFRKWLWADGSEAVIDSRGFAHLKSSDKSLPEITVVMILGRVTACWASDGQVCGSEYFTGAAGTRFISAKIFNKNYIQPFISRLL